MSIDHFSSSQKPEITIRGEKLKNAKEFKYLGTYFTSVPTAKPEKTEMKPKGRTKAAGPPKQPAKKKKAPRKSPKPTSFQQKNLDYRLAKANGAFYGLAAPLYRRKDIHPGCKN